jgi:acetyl esterase/lipase
MCSRTSGVAPVAVLRWCWQAYLQLKPPTDDGVVPGDMSEPAQKTLDQALEKDSNRTAWTKSKWKQNPQWERLVDPVSAIPLAKANGCPVFVIGTGLADPLHDEGVLLVEKLQRAGFAVTHVDSLGNHVFCFMLHPDRQKVLVEAWRSAIWDQ